jgi:hypothetical protein
MADGDSLFPPRDVSPDPPTHTTVVTLKQHDTGPALEVRFVDEHGDPVELDPATDTVTFHMETGEGETLSPANAATIESGPEGVVRYEWGASDTADTGTFFAEFRVTFNDGQSDERTETFPNSGYITVEISEEIG